MASLSIRCKWILWILGWKPWFSVKIHTKFAVLPETKDLYRDGEPPVSGLFDWHFFQVFHFCLFRSRLRKCWGIKEAWILFWLTCIWVFMTSLWFQEVQYGPVSILKNSFVVSAVQRKVTSERKGKVNEPPECHLVKSLINIYFCLYRRNEV